MINAAIIDVNRGHWAMSGELTAEVLRDRQHGSAAIGNLNMAARLVPALGVPIQATIVRINGSRWSDARADIASHLEYINRQLVGGIGVGTFHFPLHSR